MKVKLIITFLFVITLSCTKNYDKATDKFFSPSERNIDNFNVNDFNQNGKYYFLCKIWGFLKYHHTNLKKGKLDWDAILLQTLEKINSDSPKKNYEKIILDLIIQAGEVESKEQTFRLEEKYYLIENFKWFNDTIYLTTKIKEKLFFIKNCNTTNSDHHYVNTSSYGNLDFESEKDYSEKSILKKEFRLLALFRYWNIINYFYPYKYDLDNSWNKILYEYTPQFISCNNELDYNILILKLCKEINDSHVNTNSKILRNRNGKYIGNFNVLAIDSFLIVNGFRVQKMQNNLYVGDIILTLNSRPIQLYYDSLKQYISASNDASLKRDVGHYIFRTNKKFNKLTLVRNRDTLNIEDEFYEESVLWDQYISERRSFARQNVGKIIEDGIGYIKLDQIFDNNLDMSLDWMFSSTSAVILDLRGHPNDTYEEVIKKFFNGDGYFWKFIYPDIDFPGAFRLNEKPSKIKAKNNQEIYKGQLIILVDENTQSHAEFSVMAFQLVPKIKIIGTQTAGADGNISVINLPGGINTSFSGIGIFYPDMKKTQRIGIIPDIYVNRTLKGAIEGKDEILDAAILYIKTL